MNKEQKINQMKESIRIKSILRKKKNLKFFQRKIKKIEQNIEIR